MKRYETLGDRMRHFGLVAGKYIGSSESQMMSSQALDMEEKSFRRKEEAFRSNLPEDVLVYENLTPEDQEAYLDRLRPYIEEFKYWAGPYNKALSPKWHIKTGWETANGNYTPLLKFGGELVKTTFIPKHTTYIKGLDPWPTRMEILRELGEKNGCDKAYLRSFAEAEAEIYISEGGWIERKVAIPLLYADNHDVIDL